jgi:hypothetical protein
MEKLTRSDLYPLERYAEIRSDFRARVMAHKVPRRIRLGEHATLYFEDRLTMQYQVQEMLRVERIFESEGIQEELDAYNPLIPDGDNLKATFMIEYPDVAERRKALADLVDIEDHTWVRVGDLDPVYAIADEDLERDSEDKTSSVHFLRFQLAPDMVEAARSGARISIGIGHPAYQASLEPISETSRASLAADLG